jgi:hypothetical protein
LRERDTERVSLLFRWLLQVWTLFIYVVYICTTIKRRTYSKLLDEKTQRMDAFGNRRRKVKIDPKSAVR